MNTFTALHTAIQHLKGSWLFSGLETTPIITIHFKTDRDKHKFSTHVKHDVDLDHMVHAFTSEPRLPPDVMELDGVRINLYSPSDLDRGRAFEPPRG